jgi:DNA repair exonuclease SbcCD ATPase subunit
VCGTLNKLNLNFMKINFSASLILISSITFAQSISVKDGNEKFSTGSQHALITTIYENNNDHVISEWKKVLKDFKHEKVKDSNDEVFGDNILIKDWGNNTADFYTRFDEDKKDKTVKMSVAVDLGGTYLSSSVDKDKLHFVEKMMKEFAIKMTKAPIEEQLKSAEKTQEKMEDKQKDLEKDKKDFQEDIEDYKNKITKAEKEIADKNRDLDKKKSEVNAQKKVVEASKDAVSEQAKSSKKIYEKLEDQQKDLEKDIKDLKEDIKDYQDKIKKAEKDIKSNEEDQVKKKKEIEEQKKVVEDWKKKLDKVN